MKKITKKEVAKIETKRILKSLRVLDACKCYGWYTRGTNEQYTEMLDYVQEHECDNLTDRMLLNIASDIVEHSNYLNVQFVMNMLQKECDIIYRLYDENGMLIEFADEEEF